MKLRSITSGILAVCIAAMASNSFAYKIGGTVYCDSTEDGVISTDDILLPNVGIIIESDQYGTFTESTDANGEYLEILHEQGAYDGTYVISVDESTLGSLAFVIAPEGGSHEVTLSLDTITHDFEVDFLVDDPSCGGINPSCGDGNLDEGEQCDDGNLLDGDGCSASCTVEIGGQGCTPGYWKQDHHFDSWVAYTPDTLFSDVFENAFPGATLIEVLSKGGGGLYALGRHAVAGLLNTASDGVSYDMGTSGVIGSFNSVFPGSKQDYNATKNVLQDMNELGCPLN
ncbi:MAG: hypothetical protein K6L76_06220 [Agarilytica sp.]